jgi:hypothetical protein
VRPFVGIDLGTTNSAVAYIEADAGPGEETPPVHIFEIPQLVAAGAVEPRRTLPSFLYVDRDPVAGAWAREQGALTPARLVHSAKSWLSNAEVDRTAKILPWDAPEGGRLFSPVEVSSRYLAHMREAWDRAREEPLAAHEVVLTVPASFEEEARELTVAAAREAGVENLTLIEEPAAAFYAWIATHLAESRRQLRDGMTVLVCDVGGGTSDFTLIRVARSGDAVDFTRTAVGRHLLLGGDNLDLALSWLAESKLGKQLSIRQRSALRRQCCAAKERLLGNPDLAQAEITVLGAGSSLIGGALRTEILREEALEVALDGFLPLCDPAERPAEDKLSPFRETGLPYVADPAVTRHLAAFLADAGGERPDAILFNGGFFIPEICRRRVADALERWHGRRPAVLENHDLDLAVAVGAAYYNWVRGTGQGLRVRGGLPRTYYLGLDAGEGIRAVCMAPRGAEEGATFHLDREGLQLVANKPVSFRLYSSVLPSEDALGDVAEFPLEAVEDGRLHLHAPLNALIRYGKPGEERRVPVRLGAHLTAVGTLELWAETMAGDHRWRLQFELRKAAAEKPSRPAAVVAEEAVAAGEALIRDTFERTALAPEELPARLEQTLALGRAAWPIGAIRRFADLFLRLAEGRRASAAMETRWLNLCGLCLRPGFGYPGDEDRVEAARKALAGGPAFANQTQNQIEWWIFWGRLAGGLNRAEQEKLYRQLAPVLAPKKGERVRVNTSLLREMWRAAASLELLPGLTRTDLGERLIERILAGDYRESELWCLSRIGARELFYGPANQVLPPATAARWAEALLKVPRAGDTVALLARRTGDAARDLSPGSLELIRRALEKQDKGAELVAVLDGQARRDLESMSRVFGEELPSGLKLET